MSSPHPNDHDDEDSLFGSPPPSPGRSPSPGLALPTRRTDKSGLPQDVSTITNVGTIALPGSQPSSELFVNPLAPPLAFARTPTPTPVNSPHARTSSQSTTASAASSGPRRSSNSGQSGQSAAGSSRPKKRKTKPTTPRPQVEIPLPNPSGPVPPNFLRSQTGLLGVAGLVGGVKPKQLKLRGQTPTNPIIVEDEPARRVVIKAPPKPRHKPRVVPSLSKEMQMLLKAIDPSEMPVPTKQEILAVLVKEKDLTPIIQGLMKLGLESRAQVLASSQPPPTPGTSIQSRSVTPDGGPPSKRRKVSSVPAGAHDWDIPYPFLPGQGPAAYQGSWKTERGKQLISQLVELTNMASKKAAVQKFLKVKGIKLSKPGTHTPLAEEEERVNGYYRSTARQVPLPAPPADEERVNKYYKPITATYGLAVQRPPFPVIDPSRPSTPGLSTFPPAPISRQPTPAPSEHPLSAGPVSQASTPALLESIPSQEATPAPSEPPSQEMCDFVTSLLGMNNRQRGGNHSPEPSLDDNDFFAGLTHEPAVDNSFIDEFLTSLSGFQASSDPSIASTPAADPFGLTFQSPSATTASTPNLDFPSFGNSDAFMTRFDGASTAGMGLEPSGTTSSQGFIGSNIDLNWLERAHPLGDLHLMGAAGGSPNGSTSHFTGGPTTPASADWDMSLPDVFAAPAMNVQDPLTFDDPSSINIEQPEQGGSGSGDLEGWDVVASLGKVIRTDARGFGLMFDAVEGETNGSGNGAEPQNQATGVRKEPGNGTPTSESQDEGAVADPGQRNIIDTASQVGPQSFAQGTTPVPSAADALPEVSSSTTNHGDASDPAVAPFPSGTARSSKTPVPVKSNLASQKEETINRIKARKAELEAELQKIKLQLWETTVEQGGLSHVVHWYQEKENDHQQQQSSPQTEHQQHHFSTQTGQAQVLAAIDNTPPSMI